MEESPPPGLFVAKDLRWSSREVRSGRVSNRSRTQA
jgi:hypothetical protein